MKKNIKKVMCSFIILIFVLATSTLAVDFEIVEAPYSEAYEEYLGLSDEEKSEVLEPRKYAISNTYSSTNEALLANERITLKNYINLLRAEASITDSNFSLKTLISNNLSIRDQEKTNLCLAFATLSSLETNLALKNYYNGSEEIIYDYSEKHMAYAKTQMYTDKTNDYGWNLSASDGGTTLMATSYLSNGQGAVSEDKMPFDNDDTTKVSSSTVEDIDAETTVDNYIWFDSLDITNSSTTTEEIENEKKAIKEHIINYGSVSAAINSDITYLNLSTGAIYNNSSSSVNHAVSIVGWDDNYSKDNFNSAPTSNGAWIIRNSWGEKIEYTYEEIIEAYTEYGYSEETIEASWDTIISAYTEAGFTNDEENEVLYAYIGVSEEDGGEGYGYCYVSYEDITVYTNCTGIVSADDEVTYDSVYQLDELGCVSATYLSYSNTYDTYMANVFTRTTTDTEYLTSVGITNYVSGTYEVYINPNGTGKTASDLTKATFEDGTTQITLTAGYNTIDLKEAFELTGTNFVIVMKKIATGDDYGYFPIEYSSSVYSTSTATSNSGESFVTLDVSGYFDSNNWYDIGDMNSDNYCGNLCIKGFTVTSYSGSVATVNSTSEDVVNNDYSKASANLTSIVYSANESSEEYDLTVEITGIAVEDEDETFEQYFYLSTDSAKDTSSISSSYWKKVDSFEKQSDGTYTITLTIDEETYQDDIDSDEDYLYVYIKEIATKDSDTSTLYTDGLVITVDSDNVTVSINASSGTTTYSSTSTNDTSDSTTASSSLPYTGIRTLIVILVIAGICVIVTCKKYRSMNDIK